MQGKIIMNSPIIDLPHVPLNLKLPLAIPFLIQNIGNQTLKYSIVSEELITQAQDEIINFSAKQGSINNKVSFIEITPVVSGSG